MNEKTENLIWIFCIIVLIALSVRIDGGREIYDCDQCTIELYNKLALEETPRFYGNYTVAELYVPYYYEGECRIKWDPNQGYYEG